MTLSGEVNVPTPVLADKMYCMYTNHRDTGCDLGNLGGGPKMDEFHVVRNQHCLRAGNLSERAHELWLLEICNIVR